MPVDQAEATEAKAVSVTKVTDTALPENILLGAGGESNMRGLVALVFQWQA